MKDEGLWQPVHSTCAVEIGQVTNREKGPDQLLRPKNLSAGRLQKPLSRQTCLFSRQEEEARAQAREAREAKERQAIWRACGGRMLPHCVDMNVEAWLHRTQWTPSCAWNYRTLAVAVSALRMAPVEGRLRPVPERPSPPQPPFRGQTPCARLGTSLPRRFRPHMARRA